MQLSIVNKQAIAHTVFIKTNGGTRELMLLSAVLLPFCKKWHRKASSWRTQYKYNWAKAPWVNYRSGNSVSLRRAWTCVLWAENGEHTGGKFINYTALTKSIHVCLLQACSPLKFLFMEDNINNTYTVDFLLFLLEIMLWIFFFFQQFPSLCYFHRRTHTGFSRNHLKVKKNLFPMKFYLQVLAEVGTGIFLTCALQENIDSFA